MYFFFNAAAREKILSPSCTSCAHKKLETQSYLIWIWIGTGSWQTNRQTDERTDS